MLRNVTLREFLQNSNAATLEPLPLVHTTQGYRLRDILNEKRLAATPCNVFQGENLCYMFVGRPAYKVKPADDPKYWQLPVAFVMRFPGDAMPRRVFPFDSGAFHHQLLPSSISVFPATDFDISGDDKLIGKFIAAFYGSNESFYSGKAHSLDKMKEEHIIGASEMSIEAMVELHSAKLQQNMDDRAKSIELQFEHGLELRSGELLAIILPEQFQNDSEFDLAARSFGNDVRYYRTYPLNTASYYSQIYDITQKIIKKYADV